MPRCPRCLEEKPEDNFGRRLGGRTRRSWCRECERLVEKDRRLTTQQLRQKIRLGRHQKSFWTEEQFQKAFVEQGGKCNICDCSLTELRREGANTVHADHHPARNTPRALLCRMCNSGLGMFKDDAGLLRAAANYIDHFNKE